MKTPAFNLISPISTAILLFMLFGSVSMTNAQTQAGWHTLSSDTEPHHRHENAYAAVDNKLYLLGGRGERPVDIYDPGTDSWSTGATPPLPMHHFQAVSYEGKIYVMGALTGGYPDEDPVPNVYIYDPEADQWTRGPAIPKDRRRGAAGAIAHNGKIYLVGGIQNGHIDGHVRWFDSFDPETGEWTRLADAPRYRDHFQVSIIDGKLYAAGGRRTSQATGETFQLTIPEVDVYDFATGTWSPLPPSGDLPTERAGTTAISVGANLIVIGGESGAQQQAHAEVEAYNTETREWTALPSLNTGRHGTQAVVYDGNIYIAAGSKVRGADEVNTQEVLTIPDSLQK
ncbi:Kelch repeat-containing protein [Halalkalibaculum sp. DA384]|uniref:Kelch repeat-containing protein n=1 Tax=Halalkalibaculum sp. DA384 TaxID=3373606 RepID=UPI00375414E9